MGIHGEAGLVIDERKGNGARSRKKKESQRIASRSISKCLSDLHGGGAGFDEWANTVRGGRVMQGPDVSWAGPAGRLVSARVTGHADAEARRSVVTALHVPCAHFVLQGPDVSSHLAL